MALRSRAWWRVSLCFIYGGQDGRLNLAIVSREQQGI